MKKLLLFAAAGTVAGIGVGVAVKAVENRDPEKPFKMPSALTAAVVTLKPALLQASAPLMMHGFAWLSQHPALVEKVAPVFAKVSDFMTGLRDHAAAEPTA